MEHFTKRQKDRLTLLVAALTIAPFDSNILNSSEIFFINNLLLTDLSLFLIVHHF